MGSASVAALVPHLQQLHSISDIRLHPITTRRHQHHHHQQLRANGWSGVNLRSAISRRRRCLGRLVCLAAVDDDVSAKPQEPSTSSTGSAVEDRPDLVGSWQEKLSQENEEGAIYNFLYPSKELLPDDKEMSLFDHLEELRQRMFVSVLAVGGAILGCFAFSKELVMILEAPVKTQGVRFLQLAPGEFFFTTLKVSGYCGLLLGSPVILYEIIAFVLPGLTRSERRFLGPIVLGSSILFYAGIVFSYLVLTPAALNFFVSYAEGAVESLWSIDQYFEFVLVLMFSTGLSFQVNLCCVLEILIFKYTVTLIY
uniref:Sec-independent protein translocase protein TATCic n=1 Tax=Rhizophora mucronata TaxID=61149 RepID=A0A2P2JLX2_RHIMU